MLKTQVTGGWNSEQKTDSSCTKSVSSFADPTGERASPEVAWARGAFSGYSQRPIVLPESLNFAPMKLPPGLPSFIGLTRTATASPNLNVVARQPFLDSEFGLPPSMLHSVFWPLLSTIT